MTTATATTDPAVTGTTATGTVADRAMLVDLTVHLWGARKSDRAAAQAVTDRYGNLNSMGKYLKCLVDPSRLEVLRRIATSAAEENRRRTLPWLDGGARILSSAGYLDYVSAMNAFRGQWDPALDEFAADYSLMVAEAKFALAGLFNQADYPQAHRIRERFSFDTHFAGIGTDVAQDFRIAIGDAETARMRAAIQHDIEAATEAAMRDVATRIRDVVGKLATGLPSYTGGRAGRFNDTLVSNIRDLVAVLPSLNLTRDPAIDAITSRMAQELCTREAADLRESASAREVTAKAADAILADMGALFA